jgi:hypothetical protein
MQAAVGDAANQSSQSSQSGTIVPNEDAEPEEFQRLIEELEIAAGGRSLEGRARLNCLYAYIEFPRGFKRVAQRAVQESTRNPIGLLLWALNRNEHRKAQLAAERSDGIEDIPL